MREMASVNGVVTPVEEARIPILDRGFLYGDAAYEVVRIYGGRPFRLGEHIDRLLATCRGLQFAVIPTREALEAECLRLLDASGLQEAAFYIHLSRGDDGQGTWLREYTRPNLVIRCVRPPAWPETAWTKGIKLITVADHRWTRSELKTVNLLPRTLAFEAAREAGALEALWVDGSGCVREGLSCNVFAWLDDSWTTPVLDGHILAGITRSTLLEVCREAGTSTCERCISIDELKGAPEVFISSSTRELMPVVRIDDDLIGDGRPGMRTLELLRRYRALL